MVYGVARTGPGFVGVAASGQGLRRLTLPQPTRDGALVRLKGGLGRDAIVDDAAFTTLARRLTAYFGGRAVDFSDITLDLEGRRPFQRQVLQAVRAIPRGQVMTYREVAAAVQRPRAARAVGGAMAANPICVIIPCHRVIASDGSLGGFGGGLEMKHRMLELEGASYRRG